MDGSACALIREVVELKMAENGLNPGLSCHWFIFLRAPKHILSKDANLLPGSALVNILIFDKAAFFFFHQKIVVLKYFRNI
jgi:hypothetical protein